MTVPAVVAVVVVQIPSAVAPEVATPKVVVLVVAWEAEAAAAAILQ